MQKDRFRIPLGLEHEAWKRERQNLTSEDIAPPPRFPWMDPATRKPYRSAPRPFNTQAAGERPYAEHAYGDGLDEERLARQRAVRGIMAEALTPTMARRVALLWGFDGPRLTERAAAEEEGVYLRAVQQSKEAATQRLDYDWRMWLLWLTIWT